MNFKGDNAKNSAAADNGNSPAGVVNSELRQWPVQLHLVSPAHPAFMNCDILVAADCVAFTFGDFHRKLLKGKTLAIACPKLDDSEGYVEKLAEIFKNNNISRGRRFFDGGSARRGLRGERRVQSARHARSK